MATGAGEFEAIVLAAGAGSRFGGGKLLAPWMGGVLLDGALAAAFAAPVGRVIVVTGVDSEAVAAAARAFAQRTGETERLHVVHAEDHAQGMGASLRRGAAEAMELVVHGDQKTSRVVGRRVDELPIIPGATLAVIVRAASSFRFRGR